MKGRLVVSFVNEQGMLEAGLDYGGLVKEFLEQVPTSSAYAKEKRRQVKSIGSVWEVLDKNWRPVCQPMQYVSCDM